MTKKHVLDVGQCNPDHASIRRMLEENFDVEVTRTHLPADTLDALQAGSFDLVLINRKLDQDYSDGMDILNRIKQTPALAGVPVMIVSNYADAQQAAVAAGAELGFGKAELAKTETIDRLRKFLG